MLARTHRLHRETEIRRVFDQGRTRQSSIMTLRYHRNGADLTRAAVIVGRRIGRAHMRNRIRRQIREAYRSLSDQVAAGHDLIVLARPPIAGASFSLIRGTLAGLLQRAHLIGKPA